MFRAFLKDSAIYTVPAFISRGLSLFLIPLYTRVLSPADYGSLDLFSVFASLINLTVALEVSQGLARFYSGESDPDRRVAYASSAFWFTLACYSLFGLIALTYSHNLSKWVMGRDGLVASFQIGILYIWLNGVFYLVQNQFRWELRSQSYAVISILVAFTTAGVAVWLSYGLRWGLEGLLWGMVAGAAVGVMCGVWLLRHSFRVRFNASRLREMLIFSIPLVPSSIAVFVSAYIDRLMINHYLSIDDVGLYGIGFRLAGLVGLVMVGFQGAFIPLVYSNYTQADTPGQIARIFRVFIAFALLLFLGITLFAQDILALITTPAFYGGAVVVIYLVPAICLSQMYIFTPGIGIAKKTVLGMWINILGGFINLLLNWLLIPILGLTGAALATLLGFAFIFGLKMAISQRLYPVPHAWTRLGVATALAGVLAAYVSSLHLDDLPRLGINCFAMIVMATGIVALRLISLSEIKRFMGIIQTRLGFQSAHAGNK